MKKIQFNDLGIYSEIPKNLLSSDNSVKRIKSKTEIIREFDKEKWKDTYRKDRAKIDKGKTKIDKVLIEIDFLIMTKIYRKGESPNG